MKSSAYPLVSELRQKVEEAFADPTPSIPAREVFGRLRKHHAAAVLVTATNPK